MTSENTKPQPARAGVRTEAHMSERAHTIVADASVGEQGTLDGVPTAFASLLAPCARRHRWAVSYRCPRCGGHHLGFAYTPDVSGVRRSGCGRKVWLVVARKYKGANQ